MAFQFNRASRNQMVHSSEGKKKKTVFAIHYPQAPGASGVGDRGSSGFQFIKIKYIIMGLLGKVLAFSQLLLSLEFLQRPHFHEM